MILDALALEAILLLAASLALGAWQRHPSTTGRLTFLALCLCVSFATLGELVALRHVLPEIHADRIKYAGLLGLPPLWLGFACHVANLESARRIPWFPALLLIPGAILLGLMWSDRYGSVFMTTVQDGQDEYGPLWWVATVYGQLLALTGSVILARLALRTRRARQRFWRLLLAATSLLVVIGNALYVGGVVDWPYDPTPLLLGLALFAMRAAVFKGGLIEPLPVSQRDLLHQLPLGVILTDRKGHVLELSDVAANRLGVFEEFALGRPFDEVLAWCEPTPYRTARLTRRGRPAGRLVLLE